MATKLSLRVYSFARRSHVHAYHQLVFPLRGGASCVGPQAPCRVGVGQCILHPAGQEHNFTPDDNSRYLVADIDELPESFSVPDSLLVSVPAPLQAFCRFAEQQLAHHVNPAIEQSMGELFEELLRELDFQPRVDPRIARVLDFFEEHLSVTSPLTDLASIAGLSLSQFKALFKKETGKTPGEFLRERRMEKARALLANTDYPIGLVAERVGYQDLSSFSHRFTRHFGFSPTKFRGK